MTKLFTKINGVLMYALIVIVGLSILAMLIVEYKSANRLLFENKTLTQQTVTKTIANNIADSMGDYPISAQSIESNWQSLSANFIVYQNGNNIYPFRFTGKNGSDLSVLWDTYGKALANNTLPTISESEGTKARISALLEVKRLLIDIDTSLNSNQRTNKALAKAIDYYFEQVINTNLSPLEEVISAISFLQISPNERWNDALINSIIFTGNTEFISLAEYLFRQNEGFSKADIQNAIEAIRRILRPTNISTRWFENQVSALWLMSPTIEQSSLQNYSIVDSQWMAILLNDNSVLLLPFDINVSLKIVEKQLKEQGVLRANDSIDNVSLSNLAKYTELASLSLTITSDYWDQQIASQLSFLIAKIVLLALLVLSLIALTRAYTLRHQKRLEYLALRENFVNLVSHELKTPLASIRIMVETLQKRYNKNMSIKDYPEKVIHEVDALWLMVDNLLSLHQIKSGELRLARQATNISSLFTKAYEKHIEHYALEANKESTSFVISNNLPDPLIWSVDPILFELVVINLYSNAIKYCGEDIVKVQIDYLQDKNSITIRDNGVGIKATDWDRIFDDFYRITNQGKQQGTGIGLSLCRQIMLIHGGTIEVVSSSSTGTCWEIHIPVLKE